MLLLTAMRNEIKKDWLIKIIFRMLGQIKLLIIKFKSFKLNTSTQPAILWQLEVMIRYKNNSNNINKNLINITK